MTTDRSAHLAALKAVERFGLSTDGPTVWYQGIPYRFERTHKGNLMFSARTVAQETVLAVETVAGLSVQGGQGGWTTLAQWAGVEDSAELTEEGRA